MKARAADAQRPAVRPEPPMCDELETREAEAGYRYILLRKRIPDCLSKCPRIIAKESAWESASSLHCSLQQPL